MIVTRIEQERGRFLHWAPVFFGLGIGIYFALRWEPQWPVYARLAIIMAICALVMRLRPWGVGPVAMAVGLVAFGGIVAGARAHWVGAPVLEFRYHGPVEGRIIHIDRSQSDAVRLTLDQLRLDNVSPARRPLKIRVSLHGDQQFLTPAIGQRVAMTAHLSGPNGPVEPGGFDFQRLAWFRALGAVGYTTTPALLLLPPARGWQLPVARLRAALSHWVRDVLPGETGAFAAAITTGDRSAMGHETLAALRASNLAHLLAISGLHMGLLTGFVFQAARLALSLWPSIALRVPIKKIAAVLALACGVFYLALSGGNIATERAFIMVATMFVGLLFDRRAITLRAVAMAAMIVLFLHPEALVEPGFQMSFAATTALVAVFGWIRDTAAPDNRKRVPKWARPVLAVVMSSFIAGVATAPFGAAHFNQISHYGLLANLLCVPIMGALVMPLAVMAAVLAPIGLGWVAMTLMGPPIDWIIAVAHSVSGLTGATSQVPSPPAQVLPLITIGAILVILLRGKERILGVASIVAAFFVWAQTQRPVVLVSPSGGLVGVMTPTGRALSKPRGEGFYARSWLDSDGDAATQVSAFEREAFMGPKGTRRANVGGLDLVHLTGRNVADRLQAACARADLVIVSTPLSVRVPKGCQVLDPRAMSVGGTVALWAAPGGFRMETARQRSGFRLWARPGRFQ